ncbi:unnamed protein product [Ilex paraguariensis]|uniref:Uncharacterized protein n=1 Tax=Ilex paraguariensis TaxID=185542 RepID=A0ABC8SY79_9AQUA
MAVLTQSSLWDTVLELTKVAQEKGSDPLIWAIQLSSYLSSAGVSLPSTELANVLVSHICWDNNVPLAWKFLERALMLKIVPPMLVLALLSTRVIPNRSSRPAAFRLFMELLKRHAFTTKSYITVPNYQKAMKSIDTALHLSQTFGLQASEPGILMVEVVFSIVWQLLDASLDDEGLLELLPEKKHRWETKPQDVEVDGHGSYAEKRMEHQDRLQNINTVMAIELIGRFLQNRATSRILYLAQRNMPAHWEEFILRIQLLVENSSALSNSTIMTPDVLLQLTSDTHKFLSSECKTSSLHAIMASGSLVPSAGLCQGANRSALWIPLDLVLEDAVDGFQVSATSAIEIITGNSKSYFILKIQLDEKRWYSVQAVSNGRKLMVLYDRFDKGPPSN